MKRILPGIAVAALCFFVSCKTEDKGGNDAGAAYKQKNADFMKSIETGDFSKTSDWLADDAIDHGGGSDMVSDVKGRDSIIVNLKKVNQCFQPGFNMKITAQAYENDYLFVYSTMDGTTTANPGAGMPPNTKMNMSSVEVIKIKDGKASEHWAFLSRAEMQKMMAGSMPPPPPPPMNLDSASTVAPK